MKKILAVITSFALLLCAFPAVAYASDYSEYVEQGNFEGTTDVEYHVYSSYYVTIPTSINSYNNSGVVSVTMDNIESGYHIEVYITNLNDEGMLPVYSNTGQSGALSVLYDGGLRTAFSDGLIGTFYPADYDYSGTASTEISFEKGYTTKAGTYYGTMCFRVECAQDSN